MKQLDIFADDEFQSLNLKQKNSITNNYFDEEIADEDFQSLHVDEQNKIRDNFVNAQVDFDMSDTANKVIDYITPTKEPIVNDTIDMSKFKKPLIQTSLTDSNIDLLAPDKKLDVQYKAEFDDSNIVDQVQSSLVQQSRESARAVTKFTKRGLDAVGLDGIIDSEDIPKSLTQEDADFIVGYSKANRIKDKKSMDDIKSDWDNGDYLSATAKSVMELPSVLADSSGEIMQLLNLPSTAIAISTRVSKYEDEYIKNNDGATPDSAWYAEAIATQSAILLAERLGIKFLGKTIKSTKPKTALNVVGGIAGGAGYEGGQEYAEAISETHLTQKQGDKTLGEIATSDNAKFSAFMGATVGSAMKGSAEIGSVVFKKLTPEMQDTTREQYIQDSYNKQLLSGGITTTVNEDGLVEFSKKLDTKIKTIQSEFENLVINNPDIEIPVEAVDNIEVQEIVVAEAKSKGLDVSNDDGLNAIDKGFKELEAEIGTTEDDLTPKASEEPVAIEKPRVGEPAQEAKLPVAQKSTEELVGTKQAMEMDSRLNDMDFSKEIAEIDTELKERGIDSVFNEKEALNAVTKTHEKQTGNTLIDTDRLKELQEKPDDELSTDEQFELEDLQEEVKQLQELGNDETTDAEKVILEEINGVKDEMFTNSTNLHEEYSPDLQAENIGLYEEGKNMIYTTSDSSSVVTVAPSANQAKYGRGKVAVVNHKGVEFGISPYKLSLIEDETPTSANIASVEAQENIHVVKSDVEFKEDSVNEAEKLKPISKGYVAKRTKEDNKRLKVVENDYGKDSTQYKQTIERFTREQEGYETHFNKAFADIKESFDNGNMEQIHNKLVNGMGFESYKKGLEAIRDIKFGKTKKSSAQAIDKYFNGKYSEYTNTKQKEYESDILDRKKRTLINSLENEKVNFNSKSMSKKEFLDVIFLDGFTKIESVKRGATLRYSLSNGKSSYDVKKRDTQYIELLQEDAAQKDLDDEATDIKANPQDYLTDEESNHLFGKDKSNSNSDIIKQEVQEDGQQSSDDTIGETPNGTSDTVGVPTSQQKTPDNKRDQGSEETVSASDKRPNGHSDDGSIETELPTNDERVGGFQSTQDDKHNEQQTAHADTVLPKPNDTEVYSLEGKAPVELTKGQRKKFNAQALEIIKKPLEEITEADREILRHYTGEGGLGEVNENSINQHYTNYETVSAMTTALSDAGISMQKVLEPAVGSGNFIGFNPKASWDVVDIDTTNIEVTQRLYPQIENFHAESYETFKGKNYDLIISNVPFASEQMLMREHAMTIKPAFKAIHNFYFAHSIDKVKDNGVVAFMTSTGTMDGTTTAKSLRKYLMDRGDIIGAYRLPEKSQAKNAHTDTMIDIIFIQKRPSGVESRQAAINNQFINVGSKEGYAMNEYFIANPDNLLGDTIVIDKDKTKMGKEGWIVRGEPKLENIKLTYEPYKKLNKSKKEETHFVSLDEAREYAANNGLEFKMVEDFKVHSEITQNSFTFFEKEITFQETDQKIMFGETLKGANANKALHLQRIMTLTEDALAQNDKGLINTALQEIKSYEAIFTKSPHNDLGLKKFMRQHRVDVKLKEYMSYFDKDFNPAPVYGEQTRFKNSGELEINAQSPLLDRALFYSSIDATIDTTKVYEFMSAKDMQTLQEDGLYIKSDTNKIELSFMYYGGNVYKKIDTLENLLASGNIDKSRYIIQHKKLTGIIPKPTAFKNIKVRGNESWLPQAIKDKLLDKQTGELAINPDVFDGNWSHIRLYDRYLNKTALVPKKKDDSDAENIQATMDAEQLLNETLKPKIMNFIETNQLQEMMSDSYNRNSNFFVRPKMNGTLLRDLPKSFRGKKFVMQGHQLEGAEILVYNKKGVLAFAPGGGKTITAIVAVYNLLKQGVMKKPLFVVPVNTIAQWEETVRELYPDATVFEFPKVKSGKNKGNAKEWSQLSREEKEQMAFDLANNRYDFTIIGDTMFQKFGLPNEVLSDYVDDLVSQMVKTEEAQDGDSKKKKKELVSADKKRQALKVGLRQAYGGDVEFNFEKLGFDGLIADEVQYYKNIGMQGSDAKGGLGATLAIKYYDKNGKSINTKDIKEGAEPHSAVLGSMRSYDFRFKSKYVSQNNNGNNVILLTGTPTPNKPLELYTLLQHLDEDILKEYGIDASTDFVDTFYDLENYETTDATGKIVKREGLSSMKNLTWLSNILDRYVNYKGFESMPDLPRPKQIDVQHYLDLSKAGEVIFGDIQNRLLQSIEDTKKVKSGQISQDDVEGQLVAQGVARGASIDLRLYDVGTKGKSSLVPETLEELIQNDITNAKNNKILKTVELIEKQYKENSNSGQIVFLDRLTVKNNDGTTTSTHEEIRAKVLATGLFNENQVVFVNGDKYINPTTGKIANKIKPDMLNKIMDAYNAGEIKVIIGNTAKLGVGVDLNKKTTDIYQIDIPYRPDEIEQRNNRGVRQGNENEEVRTHQFFQIGTFDKRSYDIVLAKRGFNDIYGFSDNNDVDFEDGVAQISNKNTTDPYQAIIDLEKDPFVRERLRKQRMVDNAVVDANDLKNIVEKIKANIQTKNGSRKNYEDAIKSTQRQQLGENLPEYKNIKDADEKQEKLDAHVQSLKDRVTKYEKTIEDIDAEIKSYDTKLLERSEQQARHQSDTKFVTDEFTKDGKNVDLELIKQHFTEQEILESEDGSGDTTTVSNMRVPNTQKLISKSTTSRQEKSQDEINHYARANGFDEAGVNYIPTYGFSGLPARPVDGMITIGARHITLPTLKNPMNADSVRVHVSDIVGSRLYEAKIKNKSALGKYQRSDSAIRVKNYSDMEVLAHEMAHYLDYFHNNKTKKADASFFRKEIMKNKDEVKALSYTTDPKNVISEGFAEFVRLWLTNYNALELVAPNMVKEFAAKLAKDKELNTKMYNLQKVMHQYYFQGEHTMLRSKRGGELNKDAKKIQRSQAEIAKNIRQKAIDKIHTIKRIEAEIKGDVSADAIDSAYKSLQLVNGHSSIMYSAMNIGVPKVLKNGDISYGGKSLNDIFTPATKVSVERVRLLEDYLVAKRASELMGQGRENLITADEIKVGLDLVNIYPEFETIFDEYQEFNDSMLDFYVDMKMITTTQRENFQEMNKNYVPFNRITESVQYGEVPPAKIGQRLTGGTHSLGNIMENIIDGIESNIKEALISRGKSMFYEMLETSGMGGVYATKVSVEDKLVQSDMKQQAKKVATIMAQLGVTVSKDGMILSGDVLSDTIIDTKEIEQNLIDNPSALEFWTHGHKPSSAGGSYIDSVIINDKKVYFETNDIGMVDALTSFKGSNYGAVVQALMSVKNIMTWNITNNPLFYLTNFVRDTTSASVLSKNKFIPVMSSVSGMYHFITKSKTFKEFMASGAGYGTRRTSLGGDIQAMQMLNVNRGFELVTKLISAMEYGADVFEYGTRVGEFAISQKAGKSNMQSAFEAREISTDFAIKGSDTTLSGFMSTVPFMKAGLLGIDKTARRIFSLNGEMKFGNAIKFKNQLGELQKHKIKIYATGGIIAGLTLALWFNNKDDERYKKLTRDSKLMYWHFFIGKNHIKIPRPYDIGFAFASVPEIIADGIYTKHGEQAAKDFVWGTKTMFSIGDISGLFQPILEDMTNTNWTGSPIIPANMKNLDDLSDQYFSTTPLLYKELGKATGVSPIKTQHYVDGYLGLTAKMVEEITENMLWNKKEWGARPFERNTLEFLTYRFKAREVESRTKYSEKYYELMQKASGVKASYDKKRKSAYVDGGKDVKEYMSEKEKQAYIQVNKMLKKYNKTLTKIKTSVEMVSYDKSLTKARKEKLINEAYENKTKIFKEIVDSLEKQLKLFEGE